jgi:hypothetical protein
VANKPGLYANIAAKKARIKAGSGEKMRKVGSKGAPTAKAFNKTNTDRAKSFKARHAKNIAKGKMSAAYWANKVKW